MSAPILAAPSPAAHAGRAKTVRQHAFTVALPPAEAFAFFEPVGEKRWAADWQPAFASAADARLHVGSVFTVERPAGHGGGRVPSVWTITRYEPPRSIGYFNVLPGIRATRITVGCAPEGGRTCVTVRYDYTGLSPAGDAVIAEITEDAYRRMIDGWSQAVAEYLARGTPASP